MTNDTSRPSASGTTGRVELLVDGQPVTPVEWPVGNDSPGSTQIHIAARSGVADFEDMLRQVYPDYRVFDFTGRSGRLRALREDLRFRWWDAKARVRHLVGLHTMIPVEEWDVEAGSIRLIGDTCWLCEHRA